MAAAVHINMNYGDWQTPAGARAYQSVWVRRADLPARWYWDGWYPAPTQTSRDVLELRRDLPVTCGAVTINPAYLGNVSEGD